MLKVLKCLRTLFFILFAQMKEPSFEKKKNSIKELLNIIYYFSSFTGLKPHLSKCKVAG